MDRVEINAPDGTTIANSGLYRDVLRQQPNTRFIGVRLPLQIHLMVRPSALAKAQERRLSKGKPEGGLRWWLANRMGEPPVLYDDYLAERSRLNLAALAQQMGYLDATRALRMDSVDAHRARLEFVLDAGNRWMVRSCSWSTEGSGLNTSRLEFDASQLVG